MLKFIDHVKTSMKGTLAIPALFATMIAVVLVFGAASAVMADSEEGAKSYKRHWAVPIGDATGSLEITEETSKSELKDQAKSLDELDLSDYPDITKVRLGKAVNDKDQYFLVWKLMSVDHDEESDTRIKTIYVLDAGTGEPLLDEPIKKEGGCGYKNKSETTKTSA